jgi:hypothetical protein
MFVWKLAGHALQCQGWQPPGVSISGDDSIEKPGRKPILGTLAAAYAERGRFDKSRRTGAARG